MDIFRGAELLEGFVQYDSQVGGGATCLFLLLSLQLTTCLRKLRNKCTFLKCVVKCVLVLTVEGVSVWVRKCENMLIIWMGGARAEPRPHTASLKLTEGNHTFFSFYRHFIDF